MAADAVVRTEGLTKAFGDVVAVDHLDLELHRGEVFGYLGPRWPIAESYAGRAVDACEDDAEAGTLAESTFLLGKVTAAQARQETGARADDLRTSAAQLHRRAAELFDTASADDAAGQVRSALGRMLLEQGSLAEGVAMLRQAAESRGDAGSIRLELARVLTSSGQSRAAIDEYTKYLLDTPQAAPTRVEALIERAKLNAADGDPDSANRDLDEAMQLRPEVGEREDVQAARHLAFRRRETRRS